MKAVDSALSDPLGSLDVEGHREHRQRRHHRHPQGEVQRVGGRSLAAADVADGPAQTAREGEHDRQQGGRLAAVDGDGGQTGDRKQDADHLPPTDPLGQEDAGEEHGEGSGGLQDERGEPARHAGGHAEVEEGELQHADAQTGADQPTELHLRSRDQQDRGNGHEREAERDQEQRREVLQRQRGGREVEPPADGDEQSQETVAGVHVSILAAIMVKHNRHVLHSSRSQA